MDDDWGGLLAQADFTGSGVEIFGAVAVEGSSFHPRCLLTAEERALSNCSQQLHEV